MAESIVSRDLRKVRGLKDFRWSMLFNTTVQDLYLMRSSLTFMMLFKLESQVFVTLFIGEGFSLDGVSLKSSDTPSKISRASLSESEMKKLGN